MKTVHIVYGPPLAGKSTFVRENMGPDDLVFDMDAVQNALCYGADHAGKPHTLGAAIALRNAFIACLNNKRQDARGDAWVIISSASPEYFARRFFGARIEVTRLSPPLAVCLKRLELDDTRPDKSFWRQPMGDNHNPRDKPRNERRKDPSDSYENVRGTRRLVRRAVRRLPRFPRPREFV